MWRILRNLCALVCPLVSPLAAITVELFETLPLQDAFASGEYTRAGSYQIENSFGGVDPIESDCYVGRCVGLLTRVSHGFSQNSMRTTEVGSTLYFYIAG